MHKTNAFRTLCDPWLSNFTVFYYLPTYGCCDHKCHVLWMACGPSLDRNWLCPPDFSELITKRFRLKHHQDTLREPNLSSICCVVLVLIPACFTFKAVLGQGTLRHTLLTDCRYCIVFLNHKFIIFSGNNQVICFQHLLPENYSICRHAISLALGPENVLVHCFATFVVFVAI